MTNFQPTLYLNHTCPFCLKLVMYLAQAEMLDQFKLDVFEPGSPEHEAVKEKLAPHVEKVSFPAAEIEPGVFKKDSDALIAHYETKSGKKAGEIQLLDYYVTGVMKKYTSLFKENMELKKAAA